MSEETPARRTNASRAGPRRSGSSSDSAKTANRPRLARRDEHHSASERQDERRGLSILPPEIEPAEHVEIPGPIDPDLVDDVFKAMLGKLTWSVTPAGLAGSYFNWLAHFVMSPGKQMRVAQAAAASQAEFARFALRALVHGRAKPTVAPLPHDNRFDGGDWHQWPYNVFAQAFLLTQQWWNGAARDVPGVRPSDERVVSFVNRQLLDHAAPCNFVATNPRVARTTVETQGRNLVEGFHNWVEDAERAMMRRQPVGSEEFVPGEGVATTPGRVIYRNRLIELIQYAPQTDRVRPEPVLIVPAWIMKYYVLDLSPHNSLIGHLVDQGYTVFCISWRNPTADDRDLGLDDYREKGVMDALAAVNAVVPDRKVHAAGYCIGGTLLAIAAAEMARRGDDRLGTITLLATQIDFSDAGEMMLFISESEVSYLENIMRAEGFLDSGQMAGAFRLLRSNDLIWSRYIQEYLMGERPETFDLMAWNADGTRLPYRMHAEYLRRLLLGNEFADGQYTIDDRLVSIANVRQPVFCVATKKDHIAPWRSVYKVHLLADTTITFALTNGGHNAGIVSEPGHEGRHYLLQTRSADAGYVGPETWLRTAESHDGSWWHAWWAWLDRHSGAPVPPPETGAPDRGLPPLEDAPGTYVHQR